MVYKFAPGFSCKIPAQVVGKRLEQIRQTNSGLLCPRDVVEDARPKKSPLHDVFLWNNSTAAELYREEQARRLIRSVQVVHENKDKSESEPIYVSVGRPYGEQGYKTVSIALTDEHDRDFVLNMARSQLLAWEKRYGYLAQHAKDLAAVLEAIKRLDFPVKCLDSPVELTV